MPNQSLSQVPRLRSTAKYSLFNPSALATSPLSLNHDSSLAAISSKSNASIILFNLSQPYEPQLIYHSTHNSATSINLLFSHNSHMLAASYDSSVLVYDCTGEALQPLLKRIGHGDFQRESITCLSWGYDQGTDAGDTNDFVTCSDHIVLRWDLRFTKRPSISFKGDGFVSIIGNNNEIGALTSNGDVMVYDVRKNSVVNDSGCDFVRSFRAHEIGVGIERVDRHWLTWGLDGDNTASVKFWAEKDASSNVEEGSTDNYWYMGEKTGENVVKYDKQVEIDSNCTAELQVENLTTVKVPLQTRSQGTTQTGFLTMSNPVSDVSGDHSNPSLWQADLWSFSPNLKQASNENDGINCLVSFQSGGANDSLLSQMVGKDYADGHLIAADLSCLSESVLGYKEDKKIDEKSECSEMRLCTLTSSGYFTTHAIPEASELYLQSEKASGQNRDGSAFLRYHFGMHKNSANNVKIFLEDDAGVSKGFGRKRGKSDLDFSSGLPSDFSFAQKGAIEGGTTQFDFDDEHKKEFDNVEIQVPNNNDFSKDSLDQTEDPQNMEEIDLKKAAKVPSPRFCGAVFGNDGKLMTFNNGCVKSMWQWYTSDYQLRPPLGLREKAGETQGGGKSSLQHLEDDLLDTTGAADSTVEQNKMNYPHSVADLMKMTEAAEVAQWGNRHDDDSNGEAEESSQRSIESDESSDESDTEFSSEYSDESFDMYENYFGKLSRMAPYERLAFELMRIDGRRERDVSVRSRTFSESFMNPTTKLEPKVSIICTDQTMVMNGQCPELAEKWKLGPWRFGAHRPLPLKTKSSQVSNSGESKIERIIVAPPSPSALRRKKSMITYLQKLYYQDPKGSGSAVPLDQKVMQKGEHVRFKENPKEDQKSIPGRSAPHIETISATSSMRPADSELKILQFRRNICLHNAECATNLGQKGKADVWNMLAEIINSISSCSYDDFDGWHGPNGSALGRGLIMNILKYYEVNGDVQMLATIVSVLGGGRSEGSQEKDKSVTPYELLLPRDNKRYDIYRYQYGNLLYRWGKLTIRAELNKHLTTNMRAAECAKNTVTFAPSSHLCSICTLAVRGLFTVCIKCGHGGHVDHIMSWFAISSVCPTGCGCSCTLVTLEGGKPIEIPNEGRCLTVIK